MPSTDMTTKTGDFDTLQNSSVSEIAELVGVEVETLEAWEHDRATPRSNRLTMLAGILGASPSWLLFGRGASPAFEAT